jgi:hypothetical protein
MGDETGNLPLGGGKRTGADASPPPAAGSRQAPGKLPAAGKSGGRPAVKSGGPMTWYKVVKGGDVAGGGGKVVIPTGEVVNSVNYDLDKLRGAGIVLEQCEAPAWYRRAQGEEFGDEESAE